MDAVYGVGVLSRQGSRRRQGITAVGRNYLLVRLKTAGTVV